MNRLLIALILVAAPLVAAEKTSDAKPAAEPKKAEATPAATTTAAPAETTATAADSPMVAAAKRANRQQKKPGFVITNETLAQSKGVGFTTTEKLGELPPPAPVKPAATVDAVQAQKDRERRTTENRQKAAEQDATTKKQEAARLDAENMDDMGLDDPSVTEHRMAQAAKAAEEAEKKAKEKKKN